MQFEPAPKLTHRVSAGMRGGIECYGSYGSLSHLLPGKQRARTLYAVADVESHGFDVNVGIEGGFVNAADKWVLKAIVALPLE